MKYCNSIQTPFLFFIFLITYTSLSAQNEAKSIWIEDRGSKKEMLVAENEFYHPKEGFIKLKEGESLQASMSPKETILGIVSEEDKAATRRKLGEYVKQYQLVLYPKGKEKDEINRRFLTNKILIKTNLSQSEVKEIARLEQKIKHRDLTETIKVIEAEFIEMPAKLDNHYLVQIDALFGTLQMVKQLRENKKIISAEPLLAWQASKKDTPNDTRFSNQWHLQNTGQGGGTVGIDANIVDVWGSPFGTGITGDGVRIAIVDDGLETSHPDLNANVDTSTDYDFNDNDDDPTPTFSFNDHGTSCAGVAAGIGNNGIGITGAAPEAELVGLTLIAGPADDLLESQALSHHNTGSDLIHIYNNSWGPSDNGNIKEAPGPLTKAVLEQGTSIGRNGLGVIYTWAGGNGLDNDDNSNYDGYANSIHTISIGAVSNLGTQAWYSESGANLIVVAPSGGGTRGITTTRTNGNYTNNFGGTSSACPLVAGVVALMLEANPHLGWRDVQEILLHSATKVDANDNDWITNEAGINFNHKYGGGMLNAQEAVTLSQSWESNLNTQISETQGNNNLNQEIPDDDNIGVTHTFDMSNIADFRVEQVEVTVDITHSARGDLQITLTSPEGTSSVLAEFHGDVNNDYDNWTFMTARNWGENARGTWTLNIIDGFAGDEGTLNIANIKIYGSQRVMMLSPAHNSINVPQDTDLEITFAQNISQGVGNIYLLNKADDAVIETIDINDNRVNFSDNILTINNLSLAQNTEYYVNIDSDAILDLANKPIKAFDNTEDWNFTTVNLATNLDDIAANSLKIYPNPVDDILQIEISEERLQKQNASYQIYDIQGRLYQSAEIVFSEKQTKLNLSTLEAGTYIFYLKVGNRDFKHTFIKE